MAKQIAALDISNRVYKFVIGYVLDNKVDILYKCKKPLSVPYKDGDIFDIGSLANDLSKLVNFETSTNGHKITINVNEITLVLPAYGLQVYNSVKTTNTVSNVSKIGKIDISNATALVKKEKIPNVNDKLIDIIPNKFIIDDNRSFKLPPLNETSQTLTIDANVYTLPEKMVDDTILACEKAGLKPKRAVIAPIGISEYLRSIKFKYDTYVLVDFSNSTTTLSFVGAGSVYNSNFYSLGIDDLTDRLMKELNVDRTRAEYFKNVYGYDSHKNEYSPVLVNSIDNSGINRKFKKDDIVQIVLQYLKNWMDYFTNSYNNLLQSYDSSIRQKMPIVIFGEGASLNGLRDYILKTINSNPVELYLMPTVGCREPEFAACLSAIYFSSSYRGALEDENKNQISQLNRVNNDSNEEKNKYTEIRDEL